MQPPTNLGNFILKNDRDTNHESNVQRLNEVIAPHSVLLVENRNFRNS